LTRCRRTAPVCGQFQAVVEKCRPLEDATRGCDRLGQLDQRDLAVGMSKDRSGRPARIRGGDADVMPVDAQITARLPGTARGHRDRHARSLNDPVGLAPRPKEQPATGHLLHSGPRPTACRPRYKSGRPVPHRQWIDPDKPRSLTASSGQWFARKLAHGCSPYTSMTRTTSARPAGGDIVHRGARARPTRRCVKRTRLESTLGLLADRRDALTSCPRTRPRACASTTARSARPADDG